MMKPLQKNREARIKRMDNAWLKYKDDYPKPRDLFMSGFCEGEDWVRLNSLPDSAYVWEHLSEEEKYTTIDNYDTEIAKRLWLEYEDTHVGRVGVGALSFLNWLEKKVRND